MDNDLRGSLGSRLPTPAVIPARARSPILAAFSDLASRARARALFLAVVGIWRGSKPLAIADSARLSFCSLSLASLLGWRRLSISNSNLDDRGILTQNQFHFAPRSRKNWLFQINKRQDVERTPDGRRCRGCRATLQSFLTLLGQCTSQYM